MYIIFLLLLFQNISCLKLYSMENITQIKPNQLLTILTNFPKEYEISFDFKPTSYLNQWESIIHFTIGGNYANYGDRSPGVWISPYNDLYFASAINGSSSNEIYSTIIPPINEWIKVKISQIKLKSQYIYTIDIANNKIYSTQNTLSKNFSHVKVYMSDPWYSAQPGFIRNLTIVEMLSDRYIHYEPLIKFNISGQLNINFLFLNTTISYAYETGDVAYNLTWKYMLPYFSKISTQSDSYLNLDSFYKIPGVFVKKNIHQYINITLDMESSSLQGGFTLEIPLKISFNDAAGYTVDQYTSFKTILAPTSSLNPIEKNDKNALKESYSRGIYWDQVKSRIYVCMNLYVATQKTACYMSNNNGEEWSELDIRVGSVLGHHLLTRDLYVIHRNQKTYLMYYKIYKKWLAVPNSEFQRNISANLNFSACLKLDGLNEQILTFQT
ncbi:uncharacterized protein LOC136091363 [Hydra vulgaris]|uniref:Uncharacterized protein LOC136091363 n=1 Tax=Hydra vulgaris TaxID=6087 RepID=A0ABM4DK47_HYDVU